MRSISKSVSRLSFLSLLTLTLVSCGGTATTVAGVCKVQFWNGSVGLCLPTGWSVMDRDTLASRGVPADVVAAFQKDKPDAGQYATITVTKEDLAQPMDSVAYSKASIQSVATISGYKQLDLRDTTVDGAAVSIHVFSAQPSPDQPERRFYQVSAVSGATGFTVTAIAPLSVSADLQKDILAILGAVTFKEPTAAASSK